MFANHTKHNEFFGGPLDGLTLPGQAPIDKIVYVQTATVHYYRNRRQKFYDWIRRRSGSKAFVNAIYLWRNAAVVSGYYYAGSELDSVRSSFSQHSDPPYATSSHRSVENLLSKIQPGG